MELILLLVLAAVFGYWFARSNTDRRVVDSAKSAGSRLRRKPKEDTTQASQAELD